MAIVEEKFKMADEEWVEEALRLSWHVQEEARRLNTMLATYRPTPRPNPIWPRPKKNGKIAHRVDPTGIARQLAEVDLLLKQLSPREDSSQVPREARQILTERYLAAEEIYLRAEKLIGLDPLYKAYVAYISYCRRQYGYLDSQGIMQTERAVTLPLDEVYVSLQAERESDELSIWRNQKQNESMDEFHARLLIERDRPTRPLPLDQVVRLHNRIVFLGDPGAGKTTLLRFLAERFAEAHSSGQSDVRDKEGRIYGKTRLPIFFRVASYVEALEHKGEGLSVRDFLPLAFPTLTYQYEGLIRLFSDVLDSGNALVLIDGLDEITSGSRRQQTLEAITEFIREYPNNRYLITSRIAGYREAPLSGWVAEATYTLRDMDEGQVEQFLTHWCRAVERFQRKGATESEIETEANSEKTSLMQDYRTNEGVRRLAKNPLLLTILALIKRNGLELPGRRIELYRIAVETLLKNWTLKKGLLTETIDPVQAEALLGPLALTIHACSSTGLMAEKQALMVLRRAEAERQGLTEDDPEVSASIESFLRKVRTRAGILVERAPGYYGFLHLTFEEYYAGLELVSNPYTAVEKIKAVRRLPRWEEPIRLAIAKQNYRMATAWIEQAILSEDNDPLQRELDSLLYRNLILADHCAADCGNSLTALIRRLALETAPLCLRYNQNSEVGKLLHDCLGELGKLEGNKETCSFLLLQFQDKDALVRANAASALGSLGQNSPIVLEALLNALKDEERTVKDSAASALGSLGQNSPIVLEALLNALKNESYSYTQSGAASALGSLGQNSPIVLEALLNALKDKDALVRANAASALGSLGHNSPIVLEALLNALKDKDALVRANAVIALGSLEQNSPIVLEAFLNALKDEHRFVRGLAALGLSFLGQNTPIVLEALLNALKDKDWFVRMGTFPGLGSLGQNSPIVLDALLSALKDEKQYVRSSAASALGSLGQNSPIVLEALLNALKDKEAPVRWNAASALAALGQASEPILAALLDALKDNNEEVQMNAASALNKLTSNSSQAAQLLGISC